MGNYAVHTTRHRRALLPPPQMPPSRRVFQYAMEALPLDFSTWKDLPPVVNARGPYRRRISTLGRLCMRGHVSIKAHEVI